MYENPDPAGGPIVEEDHSRRWMIRALIGVGLLVAVFGGMKFADWVGDGLEDNDDGVAAGRVGDAIGDGADAESPGTTAEGSSEGDGEGEGEGLASTTPTTEPAGPVDLLRTDATPAFGAFAQVYDGNPVKVLEISLYTDYAFIDVQVPDQPTYIDEYQWRGGDGVSGPEPDAIGSNSDDLPEALFDLTELDASKIPGMTAEALAQYPQEGMEITHVIIDRFLPFDTRVLVRVYVDNPDRGGGGYVTFTPDGGFVEKV